MSGKFVPEPVKSLILEDLLLGLRKFKSSMRWKAKFQKDEEEKRKLLLKDNNTNNDDDSTVENHRNNEGLRTGIFRPTKMAAPLAPKNVEGFLDALEKDLLRQIEKGETKKKSKIQRRIDATMRNLKKTELAVMPTDKTNSCRTMSITNYKRWVNNHMEKNVSEISV